MPKKESQKAKKARLGRVLEQLSELYPEPVTALDWDTPLQLLVATILSAQCTDARVNLVTPGLFERFPDAGSLGAADPAEVEEIIHSTGFFRQKTKSIIGASQAIAQDHGGEVPADMAALVKLPGVARKTANVVLGSAFDIAEGVVVDTHVKRLSARLGFSEQKDPKKIEKDLMAAVPRENWIEVGHWLILHGRAICRARKPACGECPISQECPSSEA